MTLRKSIASRGRFVAAFVSLFLMLLSFPALAGRVQIRDPAGLFSPADQSALHGAGGEYPFDVRIVATSEHEQKADFDRYVGAQVNEPNVVVIGIDRAHRFTSVHVGTGLGIPPSQFKPIEQAGSAHFREGNWKAGVLAILTEARQAAHPVAGTAQTGAASAPRSTAGSTVFFGLVVVLVVGGLIALVGSVLARRARAGQLGPPGYPQGGPPGAYPPGGPYPPGYGPGPYGPGYGGGGGIGSTILGAGLGGLAGYELGKMAGERQTEHHHRDDQSSADVVGGDDRGNDDAGGSTGGWDEGNGGDWGGGDSGGGGDWGGGDSGGGGSDW